MDALPEIVVGTITTEIKSQSERSIVVPIHILDQRTSITPKTSALVDSGADDNFISAHYVLKTKIPTTKLEKPIPVKNVDGTPNKEGFITHIVNLRFQIEGRPQKHILYVIGIKSWDLILGIPWLSSENPIIDWARKTLQWRDPPIPYDEEGSDDSLLINFITMHDQLEVNTVDLDEHGAPIMEEDLKDKIPEKYHEFLSVFSKNASGRFPERKKWDHAINLKESFVPKSFPRYQLSPAEKPHLHKFITENLEKGYIRPSTSSMASPMFFVGKKETTEKRPCQDY